MDIEEYIKSGIIEDYCLGILSPEKNRSVAENARLHKAVQLAVEAFEQALKKYAEDSGADIALPG